MICTLGDLLLDVIVRLEGPIAEDTDTYGRTRVGAGGQAANVAAWVVALGGRSRFLGKRARDPAGRLLAEELTGRGVELAGPEVESGTGTVVSVATPNGARTMLSDRGVSTQFAPEELEAAWLDGCEWLHVPGYSLVRSPLRETALAAAASSVRISVDLSSTAAVEDAGVEAFRATLESVDPEVIFANEAEADLLGSLSAPTVVVKRGANGSVVRRRGRDRAAVARRRGRGHDRGGRRVRGRLPALGAAARRRGRRALRGEDGSDALAMADLIRIHPEVRAALEARRPVVALETTLVSHGFPSGEGGAVAAEAERRVRAAWAVPATIGVIDGVIQVGLEEEQLARFADTPDARKVGPRDLAACAAQGALGATTAGATLAICRAVGIGFLGTGGLGGVHRGWTERPDISADLGELARTEALVVASGAKSILDVDATAELLETIGVPVLGWRTDTMPLFYSRDGGPPVSARVLTVEEVAQIAQFHWRLGRHSALLLARPTDESLDVEPLIQEGVAEASKQGVRGPDVTPFVLAYLHEASSGATVEVNKKLIAENAALAAEVAVAYSRLQ